jgi:tetratricopeptide (TPR) repeat protein
MKLLENLINYLTIGLVFLLPLFFLPLTSEFYFFNKQTLLIGFTGIMTLLWLGKMVVNRALSFRQSSFDLAVILLAAAYLIAGLVAIPNKVIALTAPVGVGTVLTLTLLYFVITNNFKGNFIKYLFAALIASATLLGLVAVYQFLGFGESLTQIAWLQNKLFTPAGNTLTLIFLLLISLVLGVTLFFQQFNQKNLLVSFLTGGASVIIAVGLLLTLFQITPGKATSLVVLPYPDTWAISIEAFKVNPLFGVGPGNYLSAFNRFRPVTFNNYPFWDSRFSSALVFPLEWLTVGGLLSLGAYFFLLLKIGRSWLKTYREKKEKQLSLLILILTIVVLPWLLGINLVSLSFTFLFLAVLALEEEKKMSHQLPVKSLAWVILGLGLILILPAFFFWGRIYSADLAFRQSLNALVRNQGVAVYNQQIRAISLNPYQPDYRRAYSQTNLALANSLANQSELSDQDRTNITQLIQQAIREAKAASVLNPTDATNWENLAQIYRNLINFAQDADQWTIAAYRQTIATDPINPRIRLNFGGLYFSLGNYEQATRQFQISVDLKPDYANGYYNLAAAYRERKMYPEAYQAMQGALNFVDQNSADYQKAKEELDELAKLLPAPEATSAAETEETSVLNEPSPLPSPAIKPPIELPEEETTPEIPTEEPSPTP